MKYFEAYDPYYALIKAETKKEALKIFTEYVAEDEGSLEDELKEVDQFYALLKFGRATGEEGNEVPFKEVLDSFSDNDIKLLLIDGSLL